MDRAVFINYRSEDSTNTAAWLYTALTHRFGDERIFLDAESIQAGADFVDELLGHARSARVMLAVIGPRWLTATDPTTGHRLIDDPADWIHRELAEAFAAGVRVIPVLTDHATLPSEADLPSDIAALSRCQYRHLRRREPTSDLARIVADLADIDPGLDSTTHRKLADETSWQAHWLPRARGSEPQSDTGAWYFTGRVAARQRVCDWLADDSQPALVITGGPGTGKSALLAHLLVSSNPAWADTVPTAGPRPPVGAFDLAIHVSALTCEDVVQRIAGATGLEMTHVPELLAAMRQHRQAGHPAMVIVADAVEEAASIEEARRIAVLLRNLAGTGAVRVLAGVRTAPAGSKRAEILGAFGHTVPHLALESREFQRNQDVADYVRQRLTHDDTRDHYRRQPPGSLRKISWAVARRARYNFLIAQLTTLWLTQATTPPLDLDQPDWERSLPETVGEAMEEYLRHCDTDPGLVRRVLTALAFARGSGLPVGRTWLAISDAVSPAHTHTMADLETVFHSAAHYLLERTDDRLDEPTYRLYHHALDEHLRDYCTRYTPHRHPLRAITRALTDAVPGSERDRRDWAASDTYTRTHLAGHAAEAHQLDEVLSDPGFLTYAEPGPLLSVLHHTSTEHGQLTAAVYRLSEHLHRDTDPADRCRVLAFDAARLGAPDLNNRLSALQDHITAGGQFAWRARFATASEPPTATIATLAGHTDTVKGVAVADLDGRPVAVTVSADKTVRVWDLAEQRALATLTGHTKVVNAVAVAELDGRPVAVTGGVDDTVRVWDLTEQRALATLTGHTDSIAGVAVADLDGRPVAVTASYDKTVRVWDLAEQRALATLTGHTEVVNAVAVADLDGRPVAVTGSYDRTVRVWDLTEQRVLTTTRLTDEDVVVQTAALQGRPVAIIFSHDVRTVCIRDLAERRALLTITGAYTNVHGAAVAELDGRPVAVVGDDKTVRVWDLAGRRALGAPLTGHTGVVSKVAVTDLNGRPIAITGDDRTVRVWDLTEQRALATLTGHTDSITAVAVAELDGRPTAITSSVDRTVRVWDLTEQRALATLTDHTARIEEMTLAELDGRPIAITASMDRTVRVWDLAEQRALATITGLAHRTDTSRLVSDLAVAELDGRPIVITGDDRTVRVWDLAEQRALATLTGHTDSITGMAVAELDGRPVVATASRDRTVRLWDLENRRSLDKLVMPQPVRGLALGTSGMLAVVFGPDIAAFDTSAPVIARGVPKLSFSSRSEGTSQPPSGE